MSCKIAKEVLYNAMEMNKMVEENAELNRYVLRFLKKGVDRL